MLCHGQRRSHFHRRTPASTAFTLIELLVVIAIVGILIVIAFPVLFHIRTTAQETKAVANSRQNAHIFIALSSGYDDSLPLAEPSSGPGTMVTLRFIDGSASHFGYFLQSVLWPAVLVSFGEPWFETYGAASAPDPGSIAPLIPTGPADDRLTHAVFTRSQYWSGEQGDQTVDRWNIARMSNIKSPSAKALMMRHGIRNSADRLIGSFCDGHTSIHRSHDCIPPVTHYTFRNLNMPMLTTAGGIAGRDI